MNKTEEVIRFAEKDILKKIHKQTIFIECMNYVKNVRFLVLVFQHKLFKDMDNCCNCNNTHIRKCQNNDYHQKFILDFQICFLDFGTKKQGCFFSLSKRFGIMRLYLKKKVFQIIWMIRNLHLFFGIFFEHIQKQASTLARSVCLKKLNDFHLFFF